MGEVRALVGNLVNEEALFSEGFKGAGRSVGFNDEIDNRECANRLKKQMGMMDELYGQMEQAQTLLFLLGRDTGDGTRDWVEGSAGRGHGRRRPHEPVG